MASESASLGTPAIYLNTQRLGYIDAEARAGLVYHMIPTVHSIEQVLRTIDKIMAKPPEFYRNKSREFLSSKIDVVDSIFWAVVQLARRQYSIHKASDCGTASSRKARLKLPG